MTTDMLEGTTTFDNALIFSHGRIIGVYGVSVYLTLRLYARRSAYAWPDAGTVAEHLGTNRKTVGQYLERLIAAGLIEECEGPRHKRGKGKCYRFLPVPGSAFTESFTERPTTTYHPRAAGNDVPVTWEPGSPPAGNLTAGSCEPGSLEVLSKETAKTGEGTAQPTPPPVLGFRSPQGTPQGLQMAALWFGRTARRNSTGPQEDYGEVVAGFDALLAAGMEGSWLLSFLDQLPKPHDCWFSEFRKSAKQSWAAVKANRTRRQQRLEQRGVSVGDKEDPLKDLRASAVWNDFQKARERV